MFSGTGSWSVDWDNPDSWSDEVRAALGNP